MLFCIIIYYGELCYKCDYRNLDSSFTSNIARNYYNESLYVPALIANDSKLGFS